MLRGLKIAACALAALGLSHLVAAAQEGASEVEVVRVGTTPNTGQMGIYVAQKLGFFKEEGVNVEITMMRSGAEGQAALISGSLDFIGVNTVTAIHGLHEGFPFVFVADAFRAPAATPSTSAIIVRDDGSVPDAKALEGKNVGIISRKSLHEFYLQEWAKTKDLDLSKVNFIELAYPQMVDSLVQKQIDAVLALEPFTTRGIKSAPVKVLAYYDVEIDPGHANGIWIGMRPWAEQHPNATARFQRGVYRANEYLAANPEKVVELGVEWTKLDKTLVEAMTLDLFTTSFPTESIQKQADGMVALGWLKNKVDIASAVWTPAK